LNWCLIFE